MKKRVIGLFVLLLASILISVGAVSATPSGTCSVVPRAECNSTSSPQGNIIMGLYSLSNSHAQNSTYAISSSGNYSNVLCCWYPVSGTGSTGCAPGSVPTNKIVGLSSGTNAHAEVTGDTNYTDNVCYSGLSCVSTTSACSSSYPMNLFNLSQDSNSHVDSSSTAGFGTHICCAFGGGTGGTVSQCTITSATWGSSSVNTGGNVAMRITGTNCDSAAIDYTIYDSNGDQYGSVIQGTPNATWSNIPNLPAGTDSEKFTFNATAALYGSSYTSGKLTVTQSTTLTQAQCSDYTNSADCVADLNNAKSTDNQLAVLSGEPGFQYASCNWSSTTQVCSLVGYFGSSPDPGVSIPSYCSGSTCLKFSGCDNGYTLCENINSTEKNYYCYYGDACPSNSGTAEMPQGDGLCTTYSVGDVPDEGCSNSGCGAGAQDTCVIGTICLKTDTGGYCNGTVTGNSNCLNGVCYQNPGSLVLTGGCGDGYNLCNYNGAGFCYPGNCTDVGATDVGEGSLTCRPANSTYSGDSCSTTACLKSTKDNPLKGSCSGDSFCLAGVCYSPTAYSGTCVVQSSTNGTCASGGVITLNMTATWIGDQSRVPPSCTSGVKSVECPAQEQLPFFKWWNLAATVVVLALIYIVVALSMKKKKETRHKTSKRKTSGKKK